MEISRALPEVVAPVLTGEPVTPPAWRVRIRMDDHPGTLARIAIRLADLECNILGLTVLPVPGGVLDEIVLRPAARLTRRDLTEAIRGEGCECTALDGAAVVLRKGVPADADAVSELHRRCSMATLFRRYHGAHALPAGGESLRMVPRRRLHRLLMPPRGTSVLAVCGREAIGLGQLIPRSDGGAEVSLLVEDNWQRQGIG